MTTTTSTPVSKDDAVRAVEAASFTTGEGRAIVHCFFGGFGADWDTSAVVDAVRAATKVEWVAGFIGHELAVTTGEGRFLFDVQRPAEEAR